MHVEREIQFGTAQTPIDTTAPAGHAAPSQALDFFRTSSRTTIPLRRKGRVCVPRTRSPRRTGPFLVYRINQERENWSL